MARWLRRVAIAVGGLFALVAAAMLLANRFLPVSAVRDAVNVQTRALGGTVDFQHTRVALLPAPHITLEPVTLQFPGATGSIASLAAYPHLSALLKGAVVLDRIELDAAIITVDLPRLANRDAGTPPPRLASALRDTIASALRRVVDESATVAPGLTIELTDSSVTLRRDGLDPLLVHDLSGRVLLPPDSLALRLRCSSTLWRDLDIDMTLAAPTLVGEARLATKGADVMGLLAQLGISHPALVKTSATDVDVQVSLEPAETIRAVVHAALPELTLARSAQQGVVGGGGLDATIVASSRGTDVSLASLSLRSPPGTITGSFGLSDAGPSTQLSLRGSGLDVASSRDAVALVLGEQPVADAIFSVLQGGTVPHIELEAQAPTPDHLFDAEHYNLRGQLMKGRIAVDAFGLHLTEVTGNAHIAHGVLEGDHAAAKLGESQGHDGRLRVALVKDAAPFLLDVAVDAALADLPPILSRTVPNQAFLAQLALITDVEGRAQGHLVLEDTPNGFDARADATAFSGALRYGPLRDSVRFQGERFSLTPGRVELAGVAASASRSAVSGGALQVDWTAAPQLTVITGVSTIALADVATWLSDFSVPRQAIPVTPMGGILKLDSASVAGPLSTPAQWRFDLQGSAAQAQVSAPGPLGVTTLSARLAATQDRLSLSEAQASFEDATFTGSATFTDFTKPTYKIEVSADGTLGPRVADTFLELASLGEHVDVRRSLAVAQGRFTLQAESGGVAGQFTELNGPTITVDAEWRPQALMLRKLAVRDAASNASATANLRDEQLELNFDGRLTAKTIDALLRHNRFIKGWLGGTFTFQHRIDDPLDARLRGPLTIADVLIPLPAGPPLRIAAASLRGTESAINVDAATLSWNANRVEVHGSIATIPDQVSLDLSVSTPAFSWDTVDALLVSVQHPAKHHPKRSVPLPAVRGTVNVTCDTFSFRGFTWSPLRAVLVMREDAADLRIDEASLCGVRTSGGVTLFPHSLDLALHLEAKDEDLATTLTCIRKEAAAVSGRFDVQGDFTALGEYGNVLGDLNGQVDGTARNGRIFRVGWFAKVISLLNVTEGFVGRLPDMTRGGLAYDSVVISAQVEDGRLTIKRAILQSTALTLVARGTIDLRTGIADLTLLASPLGVVDPYLQRIPIIGRFWREPVISVPIEITGNLDNPTIIPLSPSLVASELVRVLERTVRLPIKVIQPLVPNAVRNMVP